jgi:hypothetical protein
MTELSSTIVCPKRRYRKTETMPIEACLFFYECEGCGALFQPLPGDC